MIVEERIYTLQVGTVPAYLEAYEAEGLAIQRPILGHLVGYFYTDFGALNQIVHMWAYKDLEDRRRRRARLGANSGWQSYRHKVQQFLVAQENKLLIPAPFSPQADLDDSQ